MLFLVLPSYSQIPELRLLPLDAVGGFGVAEKLGAAAGLLPVVPHPVPAVGAGCDARLADAPGFPRPVRGQRRLLGAHRGIDGQVKPALFRHQGLVEKDLLLCAELVQRLRLHRLSPILSAPQGLGCLPAVNSLHRSFRSRDDIKRPLPPLKKARP